MSARSSSTALWPAVAGAAVVAGLAGFGLAKLSSKTAPSATSPEAAAKAVDAITVPAANLAVMQIAVAPAQRGDLASEIAAPGTVAPEPGGEALITAQAAGSVSRLSKRLGDAVKAGEVLALVTSRDAAAMAADRSTASAKLALARANLAREKSLYEQRVSPRQDLETAEAAAAEAEAEARRAAATAGAAHVAGDGRSLAVVSPIAGRITAQSAALGAFVQPETELFRVADPRHVQVEAALTPVDAARVRPGDAAEVSTTAGSATATVRSVTPTLDPNTRAATAILTLASGAGLTPGDAVQVRISPKSNAPGGVIVPEEAIQSVNGRDAVFVRTPTGFKIQTVTVAGRSGGRAVIASGLSAGQPIATKNAFLLKAEATKGAGEDEE